MISVPSSLQKVGTTSPTISGLTPQQVKVIQAASTVLGADYTDTQTMKAICKKAGVSPEIFAAWFNPKSESYDIKFVECWKALASGFLEQYRPLLISKVLHSALSDDRNSAKDRETALKLTGDIKGSEGGGGFILNQQINVSDNSRKVAETIEQMPDGEEKEKMIEALKLLSKLK